MALNHIPDVTDFVKVEDCLPGEDGKFYTVLMIILDDTIAQSYSYHVGTYEFSGESTNGCFHTNDTGAFFFGKDGFRNHHRSEKVVAWAEITFPRQLLKRRCKRHD